MQNSCQKLCKPEDNQTTSLNGWGGGECKPRTVYPVKVSFEDEGGIKFFHKNKSQDHSSAAELHKKNC